jgi:hypothetical protein
MMNQNSTPTQILRIRHGAIVNENGDIIAFMSGDFVEEAKTIEMGSDLIPVVMEFIDNVNSGKLKPRATVKKFESILEQYKY